MGTKANERAQMGKQYKPRKKPHNHFPMGKQGYVPHGVGITDLALLKG